MHVKWNFFHSGMLRNSHGFHVIIFTFHEWSFKSVNFGVFLMMLKKKSYQIIAMQLLVQKKYTHWFHTCFDAIKFDIFLTFILRHSGSLILMPPIYNAQNSLRVTLRTKIDWYFSIHLALLVMKLLLYCFLSCTKICRGKIGYRWKSINWLVRRHWCGRQTYSVVLVKIILHWKCCQNLCVPSHRIAQFADIFW